MHNSVKNRGGAKFYYKSDTVKGTVIFIFTSLASSKKLDSFCKLKDDYYFNLLDMRKPQYCILSSSYTIILNNNAAVRFSLPKRKQNKKNL